MKATRHCHRCGKEYTFKRTPGRSETCEQCGWDWKVCMNCTFYDVKVAYHCRERRADPVEEKHAANYCEFFDLGYRVWTPKEDLNRREDAARSALKKLFGD